MIALVGYTGFVGSNIYSSSGNEIGAVYNSKNIKEAFGTQPELLIYAGIKAEKYLANSAPEKDMELINQAKDNIIRINPQKLVLISTIDVFRVPKNVDELSKIDTEGLQAYGYHRYLLELWVRKKFPDALIIRLPGLFGKNIKKNFIYDFINITPFMLRASKYNELVEREPKLREYYMLQGNGFYRVNESEANSESLKKLFHKLGFSALNFTDSRSVYQFYNLSNLWNDIHTALKAGITLWHPATEPISARELYEYLTGKQFVNEIDESPADYDYKTIYSDVWNGLCGYISKKEEVLKDIAVFIEGMKKNEF